MIHLGIIPDGNRRYSSLHQIDLAEGYLRGMNRLDEILLAINSDDPLLTQVKIITIYGCSVDNITKRSSGEIEKLISLIRSQIHRYRDRTSLIHQYKIKINIIGNLNYFPSDLREEAIGIQDVTASYSNYILNLAIGYDPQEEILAAMKKIPNLSSPLLPYLGVVDQMDLVIRTGKEKRTSGFFPLMTLYAEYFFLDKLWPEFTVEDLRNILIEFRSRGRRFGK